MLSLGEELSRIRGANNPCEVYVETHAGQQPAKIHNTWPLNGANRHRQPVQGMPSPVLRVKVRQPRRNFRPRARLVKLLQLGLLQQLSLGLLQQLSLSLLQLEPGLLQQLSLGHMLSPKRGLSVNNRQLTQASKPEGS